MGETVTGLPAYVWDFIEGRDSEGEYYRVHRVIDRSGRVVAKVVEPSRNVYDFQAYFHLEKAMDEEDLRFIDADAAKRFVLTKLAERAANREPTAAAPERETAEAKP